MMIDYGYDDDVKNIDSHSNFGRMEDSSSPPSDSYSDDHEILLLLDSVDELLLRQTYLSQKLSRGWIDIASARYSMGPSRISQSLFSLKPCSSTSLVSVTPEERDQDESSNSSRFIFRIGKENAGEKTTGSDGEKLSQPKSLFGLRRRHTPGPEGSKDHKTTDESTIFEKEEEEPKETKIVKQPSESLAWFGILVSPHLRAAQTSFKEALEMLVELATIQSTILATMEKLKDADLI